MTREQSALEAGCSEALRLHLARGDEASLHGAYEFGRSALAEGLGVLDMAQLFWRVLRRERAGAGPESAQRTEEFLLECLSAFEMAHRGAREANAALRLMDERREEHMDRIARELHDQAGQLLASVYLSLDSVRPHLAAGGDVKLERVIGLLNQVEDEVRRVAHELRPVILDDLGLMPALRFLGEGMSQRATIPIRVAGTTAGRLPPRVETGIYRIAQEALSNIARHANATRAWIEVERDVEELRCRICDDGQGFDPAAPTRSGAPRGLGLDSIRERLAPLGGALEIHSRPGAGTELLIRVPIEVTHVHTAAARG